ncbi:MAG: tetratricopeptide repeat protein [Candidatus Brocadiaceae bacterium]|mgnify:CR=1 FL=1|nr:tetratricopeptide repeat protein [Candidatus Brocadiaceae bacterium]
MSRFDSLEFERPKAGPRRHSGETTGTPVRDCSYFREAAGEEYRLGRLEAALRSYSRALECDTTACGCWLMQVRILIELEEYTEAGVWADKALEMFPDHPDLLAARAVICARTGMDSRAMAFSDSAMAGRDGSPYTWLARGEVLLARRGRMAGECLLRAIAESPATVDRAWMNVEVARVLRRYGRRSEALYHAKAAQAAMPLHAAVALEVGLCQESLGLPDAAQSFTEALQLDPLCDQARLRLARRRRSLWGYVKRWFTRSDNGA